MDLLLFFSGLVAGLGISVHPPGNVALFVLFALQGYFIYKGEIDARTLVWTALGAVWGLMFWVCITGLFAEQIRLVAVYTQKTPTFNPWLWLRAESDRYVAFFWRGALHRNLFLAALFVAAIIFAIRRRRRTGYQPLLVILCAGIFGLLVGAPNKGSWYFIFIYPFLAMAAASFIVDAGKLGKVAGVLLAVFVAAEMCGRAPFYRSSYSAYVGKVEQSLPLGATVFGSDNLWLGLHDRYQFVPENLAGLQHLFQAHNQGGDYYAGSLVDFLHRQGVQYIVADPELLAWPAFQNSLHPFLEQRCELVGQVSDDFYNFSDFMCKRSSAPMVTSIYRVKERGEETKHE